MVMMMAMIMVVVMATMMTNHNDDDNDMMVVVINMFIINMRPNLKTVTHFGRNGLYQTKGGVGGERKINNPFIVRK